MPRRLFTAVYANAYVLLLLTALLWAGNFVVGRVAAGVVPPVTLGLTRWTTATLILLPFAYTHLRRDWAEISAYKGTLLMLGMLGGGLFNTLQFVALQSITAAGATVFNSAAPALIALACWGLFGDRITWRQSAGIAVSLIGVLVLVLHGDLARVLQLGRSHAELLMLASFILFAIYTACLRLRPRIHPLSFATVTFAGSALVNVPMLGMEHGLGISAVPSWEAAAMVLFMAIGPSILAYLFYIRAVEQIGGTRAGLSMHLVPLFASAMSIMFLGEHPRGYHVAGFFLIITGVIIAARPTPSPPVGQ